MTNTNSPYGNAQEPKKDSVMDSLREPLASLKTAGASAAGVAKDFGQRLRDDREATKPTASAAAAAGDDGKDASFFDKVTAAAKDFGGSVKRAASATSQTPEFAEAKERIGEAAKTTRAGVTEAYGTAKANREAAKAAKSPQSPKAGSETPGNGDIIDGEVISTEN